MIFFILLVFNVGLLAADVLHLKGPVVGEWKEENLSSFDELILSWNALRPVQGKFLFYVSVKTNEWSPWLLYASWGSEGQKSFSAKNPLAKVYQDTLETEKATAFRIKVVTEGEARLDDIHALHVYINSKQDVQGLPPILSPVDLKVPGLSQKTKDVCSPTSTTAVTRYLSHNYTIDPTDFAQKVWDAEFDIYGNWVFNVAESWTYLGSKWTAWVQRLNGFQDIYERLRAGTPVVVSVRGPLSGSASPYAQGHLMAVIGYDPLHKQVLCMDPAFPSNSKTHVSYALSDFLKAWERRGNIAYIFSL